MTHRFAKGEELRLQLSQDIVDDLASKGVHMASFPVVVVATGRFTADGSNYVPAYKLETANGKVMEITETALSARISQERYDWDA